MAMRRSYDHEPVGRYAGVPRTLNLNLAFQVTQVHAAKFNTAAELKRHEAVVTRQLRGDQPVRTEHLPVWAHELRLDQLPGFHAEMFDWPPAEFAGYLMRHAYGKYAEADEWLKNLPQAPGHFLHEHVVALLMNSYRGGFGHALEEHEDVASTVGEVGQRYGLVLPLSAGPVLDAVGDHRAVALLVHRERNSGAVSVLRTNSAGGRGRIGLVSFLVPPPPDPEDELLDNTTQPSEGVATCLLVDEEVAAGVPRLGYLIGGAPGRRDIHVFLFHPDAFAPELPRMVDQIFDAAQARLLQEAVSRGLESGRVLAARVVYDAR